jgi:ectoine hydroxylase-related dioxygenase (phytanoyl-CoA dioxygenase family)
MIMNIEKHKETYERDGFIKVQKLFSRDKVEEIKKELDRYVREVVPGLPQSDYVMESDGESVRNLWRLDEHDSFFKGLAEQPNLLNLVGKLVNGEPVLKGVETFNKPAKTGSGVPPHQDNAYFCQTPPDVLTVWIAIDPVTVENGPVTYMTGSHQLGHLPHVPSGVAGNSVGLKELPSKEEFPNWQGLLDPGDALIHHCEVIHFSGPNRTNFPRCGLLMVFRGSHTEESAEIKEAYKMGGAAT